MTTNNDMKLNKFVSTFNMNSKIKYFCDID